MEKTTNINQTSQMDNNQLVKLKLEIIDKILEMYPQHIKDKQNIVNTIFKKKEQKDDNYILSKVKINDQYFYRDPYGFLLTADVVIAGCYIKKNGKYIYYFNGKSIDTKELKKKLDVVKKLSLD